MTLPNLRYLLVVTSTLDIINTVRHYDIIGVMTAGGPAGATEAGWCSISKGTRLHFLCYTFAKVNNIS